MTRLAVRGGEMDVRLSNGPRVGGEEVRANDRWKWGRGKGAEEATIRHRL